MSITIANIRHANPEEWDQIWQNCEYATYFHSREWSEVWEAYTAGTMKPSPRMIDFSDGKKALLPLSRRKFFKGLFKEYISSPGITFGGWISLDNLDVGHAKILIRFLTKNIDNIFFRNNPYNELMLPNTENIYQEDETHVLNLKEGFEPIYKTWKKGNTAAIRKAQNAGVVIKTAETLNDWKAYFECYEDSLKRWGQKATSKYNWEFFEILFRRNSQNVKLWLSLYKDKVIAGSLCLYSKKHSVYWHGAALAEYFHLRPVNLIFYEAIKKACKDKYHWFDFNPSGGHEGVKSFKNTFNPEILKAPVFSVTTTSNKIFLFLVKAKSSCLRFIRKDNE